ncbi:MAG: hypothetical protein ACYDH5_08290 [Acidimicrobiales bacterium]
MRADAVLLGLGLELGSQAAPSGGRFPDGAHFRIEIPSVEGPKVLEAVVSHAEQQGVSVNRVSQGSGAMLLPAKDLASMAAIGAEAGMEVSLFVGPREGFDVGNYSRSPDGTAAFGQLRGLRQLRYAIEDIFRASEQGIRSFLVADIGLLTIVAGMQRSGELPASCVWKTSVMMAPSNPAGLRALAGLGATTVNVPSDITASQLAEMRSYCDIPLDLYVESPDHMAGVVRGQEAGDLVAAGSPMYVKFGLSNATSLYPCGEHLLGEAVAMARTKVQRAAVAMEWMDRINPTLVQSKPGAVGLGVPEV